jgi:hypothetical protein
MRGLGAVANYDLIRIGGKDYSASELYEKAPTLFAQTDTKVYTGARDDAPVKYITKAGNPLGKYYSYLKPGVGRSKAWLMLEVAPGKVVYVQNEVVGASAIANQNVKTAQEQIKEEEAAKEKEKDPFGFYFKKYALPILAGGALIYVATQFGTTFIKAKVAKS